MRTSSLLEIAARGVRRADFTLQALVPIKRALRAPEPGAPPGAGIYTAAEWTRARLQGTGISATSGNRYGSDAEYRRYLEAIDAGKLAAVRSLLRAFDFRRYGRILELGCGDMPQAHAICEALPGLDYTATDFDPYVISQCARLPLLAPIHKAVLDATGPELERVRDYGLVTSWSLESALEDGELAQVFATCARHAVSYLLCTHTSVGPLLLALDRTLRAPRDAPGLRHIGWLRSAAEIARLARTAGQRLRWRSYHVNHAALLFTPD